jgi:hypothetical protein
MSLPLLLGRKALADFFTAMTSQKAHWYNMIAPSYSDATREELNRIFPPLSSLLNIEVTIMNQVLEASGLCRKKADIFLPTLQAWREFIAEYKIDVELTMFSLGNKRRHFLRVGSFNKMNHPAKMPVFYWRERVEPPKLRINKVTSIFALSIGQLNLTFDDEGSRMEIESESSDSSSDESESEPSSADNVEVDGDNTSARLELTTAELNLPDPNTFPLLNSLSYNPMNMDRLMQEILLFQGNKQINFTRGNNRKGSLIILLSHRHLERYEAELSKRNSAIDTIFDIIAESCKSSKEEAAECLLKSIFSKYENSFVSVAIDKCLRSRAQEILCRERLSSNSINQSTGG